MEKQELLLSKIARIRREFSVLFYSSIPGALATLYMLSLGGGVQEITEAARGQRPDAQTMFILAFVFALWLFPFEQSEERITRLKVAIKEYQSAYGENPVHYTKIERFVNTVMKLLWEKTPLPAESSKQP